MPESITILSERRGSFDDTFFYPLLFFREHDERALGLTRAELAAGKFSPFIAIIYRPMNNPSLRERVALAR